MVHSRSSGHVWSRVPLNIKTKRTILLALNSSSSQSRPRYTVYALKATANPAIITRLMFRRCRSAEERVSLADLAPVVLGCSPAGWAGEKSRLGTPAGKGALCECSDADPDSGVGVSGSDVFGGEVGSLPSGCPGNFCVRYRMGCTAARRATDLVRTPNILSWRCGKWKFSMTGTFIYNCLLILQVSRFQATLRHYNQHIDNRACSWPSKCWLSGRTLYPTE